MRLSDQSKPQTAEAAQITPVTAAEPDLLHLQRTAGNGAVQRMMVAREPAGPETWQIKAGLVPEFIALDPGPVTDRGTAASVLGLVAIRLDDLKSCLTEADAAPLTSAVNGVNSQKAKLAAGGALTHGDVVDLNFVVDMAKSSFDSATARLRSALADALNSMWRGFSSADTSVVEAQISEGLHSAFIHGKSPEVVERAKKALATVKEYKGKVDDYADYAKKAADFVNAAKVTELVEKYGKATKPFTEFIGKAGTVIDTAELLYSLTSSHGAQTEAQASITQARVFLKGLDIVVGAAVELCPGFGALWTNYYKPMTEACLQAVQKLFDIQDAEARLGSYFGVLGRWDSGQLTPPQLPTGADHDTKLILDKFPGGQPVLTFMYTLVNSGEAQLNPAVTKFFIDRKDLFNVGVEDRDKMKTESNWKVFSPSTWDDDDSSPNLASFLHRNQDNIWAQLYGALPHTLRSGG
jgi:hypothetical protein